MTGSDSELCRFECETCGSSVVVDEPALGALAPEIGDQTPLVRCSDHSPPLPMRRVD